MLQNELRPARGSRHARKRVGRGNASGHGTYSGRGLKGQKARAGGGVRVGFEGGQLPLIRRMARKRGFTNPFRVEYTTVSLSRLARFAAGTEVTPELLHRSRVVRTLRRPIKVLSDGELSAALVVKAHAFSAGARQAIEAAGGRVEVIGAPEVVVERAEPGAAAEAPAAEAPAAEPAAPVEVPPAEAAAPEQPAEAKPARRRRTKKAEAEDGAAEA